MKKLAVSSVFVAANLIASFLIVMILVRYVPTQERADFFLFQTVFFPLTALLSQTKILQIFRGAKISKVEILVDVAAFLLAAVLLSLIGFGRYESFEIICFALSIPITYRTASGFAALQRHSKSRFAWGWPVVSALLRVASCVVLLGFNVSIVFLVSALIGLFVSLLANARTPREGSEQEPSGQAEQAFFSTLFFFAVSSFAFQWDRILLGQLGMDALIITSGICLVWVLSPVSAIFATIYRARAKEIFQDRNPAENQRVFLRYSGQFLAVTAVFACVLAIAWGPLNRIAFPFADIPVILPIILVGAVALDRIGNLRLFSFATSGARYRWVGGAKLVVIILGVIAVSLSGRDVSLIFVYATYLMVSVVYCILAWRLT